jgi:anaerobic sulfite reductase subunit A
VGDVSILEILQERAATYSFLAQLYKHEVSAEQLENLIPALVKEGGDQDAVGEGHTLLRQFAQQAQDSDLKKEARELAAEYAALFLNAARKPVSPYESVYTSPDHLVMQKARDEVVAEYRKEGLDRIGDFREPEDHIAIELEFMAYLCDRAAEALDADLDVAQAYLQKQKAFLDEHLLVWVPDFCEDVIKFTQSDFFRGLAQITAEHLSMERDTVDELLAAVAE